MVHDAVDHRGGNDLVAEHVTPPGERQVRGQNQGGMLVAARHQLEEQVRGVLPERDVADLVDDEQPDAAQPGQLGLQSTGGVRSRQAGDPVDGGGERDPMAVPGGFDAEPDRQMGLAGSGRYRWVFVDSQ